MLEVPRAEAVPSPGTYEGKEAVGAWFGDWFRMFDRDFEIEEAEDLGGVIFVIATHRGRGRASGAEVRDENAYLYRLREGKIARVEFYATRADALAAVPGVNR